MAAAASVWAAHRDHDWQWQVGVLEEELVAAGRGAASAGPGRWDGRPVLGACWCWVLGLGGSGDQACRHPPGFTAGSCLESCGVVRWHGMGWCRLALPAAPCGMLPGLCSENIGQTLTWTCQSRTHALLRRLAALVWPLRPPASMPLPPPLGARWRCMLQVRPVAVLLGPETPPSYASVLKHLPPVANDPDAACELLRACAGHSSDLSSSTCLLAHHARPRCPLLLAGPASSSTYLCFTSTSPSTHPGSLYITPSFHTTDSPAHTPTHPPRLALAPALRSTAALYLRYISPGLVTLHCSSTFPPDPRFRFVSVVRRTITVTAHPLPLG
jgi:hypothetical protein